MISFRAGNHRSLALSLLIQPCFGDANHAIIAYKRRALVWFGWRRRNCILTRWLPPGPERQPLSS